MISPAAPAVKYMQDADLYIQEWLFYLHMVIRIEVFFLPCTHLKLYFPPNLLITSDIITSPQCSDLHSRLTSARLRV